jgi:hypothetical protein
MKKILAALLLGLCLCARASAQVVDIFYHLTSAFYPLDGGTPVQYVGPYSGTPVLGDFIYFNGTNWVSLNKPADGTYSVTFTAGIPSWSAGGGGGLGDPGANGVVVRTALNTTTARTFGCAATYCTYTNGSGVSGAPSLNISLNTTDDGGGIVKQAATPGTQQGSGGNANINTNGTWIEELDNLAAVGTDGVVSQNTTAASAGTQNQVSPTFKMCGTGWNTSGLASETDCWRIQAFQGGGNPSTSTLRFLSSIAGGAYTAPMTLAQNGLLSVTGNLTMSGQITNNNATGTMTFVGPAAGSGGVSLGNTNGGVSLLTVNREVTASCTSGTTCDTGTNIPAGSIVLAVASRVTTTITGATTVEYGTVSTPAQFTTGVTGASLNSGTTGVWSGGSYLNTSAQAIRVTATAGTFTAGVVEFEITYLLITPPTS